MTSPPATGQQPAPGQSPGSSASGSSASGSSASGSSASRPGASWPGASRWRSLGWWLTIAAVVAAGGILTVLLAPSPAAWPLDPASTGPGGTHALADLLTARGVTVIRAGSVGAAVTAARRAPATVVVSSPWQLTGRQLAAAGRAPGDLLIVGPDPQVLRALAPWATISGYTGPQPATPGCRLSAARLAGSARIGGALLHTAVPGAAACYRPATAPPGSQMLVQDFAGGRTVTVLGSGTPLTNRELGTSGDAALALNLLSGQRRVVWLVPGQSVATTAPPPPGQPSPGPGAALIPASALLVVAELAIAAVAAALWRMRRFGPLVAEPLPVVVRASETTEGHARLYQARRARGRAAAALRGAALGRLLPRLGLPAAAPPDAVCAELAGRTGRQAAHLEAILYGPVPPDDGALVRLATDLDNLEGEVFIQ